MSDKEKREYQKAFGLNVRQLREERDWSQEQLAAVANLNASQVSRVENGKHAANIHTIKSLAIALGKYPDELLRFDFNVRLNTDFRPEHRKQKRPGTTRLIGELAGTDFFKVERTVRDVIKESKKLHNIELKSAQISAVLKKLVDAKKLRRIQSPDKKTNYRYMKRGK